MVESPPVPFLIVGAGIGGVAAALALARRGSRVLVLEQADAARELGAGIQLAPNALAVLDTLGVLSQVWQSAVLPPAATMRDAVTGAVLTRLTFDDDFRSRYGYPYVVTHRSDLHRSLVAAAVATGLVEIRTGSRIRGLEQRDPDGVTVQLESGAMICAGAVVGADGLHSVVREYVTGGDDLHYLGDYAYRGTVPYGAVAEREGKDDVTWWVGPSMHLMQYPLRRGELYNQVAVFTSHRTDKGGDAGGPEELDHWFADKHPHVRQGASLVARDRRWSMVDRKPLDNWTRGLVTLLGDAAHPMVQYLAQGACQALEDARCLAESVAASATTAGAFQDYQRVRMPRTSSTQNWARTMGEIVHASGALATLRDELFRVQDSQHLPQVDWLYGRHSVADHELSGAGT